MNYLYKGNIKVAIVFLFVILGVVFINKLLYKFEYNYFYINLDDVFYLKKGDKVYLSGVPVGFIDKVSIKKQNGHNFSTLKVLIKNSIKLTTDSEIKIKNSGIMNSYLDIEMGVDDEYATKGWVFYSPYSGITVMKILDFIK